MRMGGHGAPGALRVRERVRDPCGDLDGEPARDPPLPDAERALGGRAQHVLGDRAAALRPARALRRRSGCGARAAPRAGARTGAACRGAVRAGRAVVPARRGFARPGALRRRGALRLGVPFPGRAARAARSSGPPQPRRGGSLQPRPRLGLSTRAGRRGGSTRGGPRPALRALHGAARYASRPRRLRDRASRSGRRGRSGRPPQSLPPPRDRRAARGDAGAHAGERGAARADDVEHAPAAQRRNQRRAAARADPLRPGDGAARAAVQPRRGHDRDRRPQASSSRPSPPLRSLRGSPNPGSGSRSSGPSSATWSA